MQNIPNLRSIGSAYKILKTLWSRKKECVSSCHKPGAAAATTTTITNTTTMRRTPEERNPLTVDFLRKTKFSFPISRSIVRSSFYCRSHFHLCTCTYAPDLNEHPQFYHPLFTKQRRLQQHRQGQSFQGLRSCSYTVLVNVHLKRRLHIQFV